VIHREIRPPVLRVRASPPSTAALASSSRSEIRRSPPPGTTHLAQSSTRAQSKGQPGGDPSRNSTTRFVCTGFAPPTAAPANSLRSEIRRSPPPGTAHLAQSSTWAQSKGQPGGGPSRNSTTRFACTCFTPPLSITNNSDSELNWFNSHYGTAHLALSSTQAQSKDHQEFFTFRASDEVRLTSSAPVLNGSHNSWTSRNKSKRTYWGNTV
jgi:hypothetical protein